MKNISEERFIELEHYLTWREFDIAESIEDFGALRELFIEVMGREPEGHKKK